MKIESRLQVTTFFSILCSFKLAHLAIHKQYIVHMYVACKEGFYFGLPCAAATVEVFRKHR